jgi:hypothetical protein
MSIKDRDTPFVFECDHDVEDRAFTGIRELGFTERGHFVVSAYTTPPVAPGEPRGTYFTSLPISPMEYRRTHRTRAAFQRDGDRLVIFDDWGKPYTIDAPSDVIDALADECARELPRHEKDAP